MWLNSSIAKKQTVAITGFLLILFIIVHLGGNLFIYGGPRAFNAYAHKLHSLGTLLVIPRALLLIIFLIHIYFIYILVLENIIARGGLKRYAVDQAVGKRTLAERIMAWSGLYIFVFVIFHILDFAWTDQHGPRTFIHGTSYGVYGLVFNSFKDPVHGLLYIIAVWFLGMHLVHGVQSITQTYGIRPHWETFIKKFSDYFALIIVLGYCSIPVYVYYLSH
jgi:succinate dehydrogenase / fumarate reductase, cytochrome b subunit